MKNLNPLVLLSLIPLVVANVEKTIFVAPQPSHIPSTDSTLDDLGLERLSPSYPTLRTFINASFPTPDSPGTDSWFFLENLTPGQRYEVRICYLATQPTSFTLDTFTLSSTMEDPSLLSSISLYSSARLAALDSSTSSSNPLVRNGKHHQPPSSRDPAPTSDSVLFLRIRAAADYFSLDRALMEHVPPVLVDVILDPFLWNIFPRSLVPTAGYLCVVGMVAVLLARWVMGAFGAMVEREVGESTTVDGDEKKTR
ncbi:hypothetical protein LV164_006862 [Aspergillus fumigatus]|nr:hypothetical protein KXX42_008894 [Aspergillus fumigatus]KAH1550481.1 hypothetical protein KXX57_009462 [Aspergillus fumigatus]KAH1983648.1 hypothetical protein KXW88_003016 [Aspergillus fumigatus]KAH2304020.1 hypothetical protein KXV47_009326 [Aspergillus fumigatus]KAH2662811.1 hypothetical protein KXV32_008950 [Aspergillus fumigatus]